MNLEQILQFIIANNATIIEALIAAILVTILFLALRAFLGGDAPEESSRTSMVELEATLKKLIEQAGKVPLTVVPEGEAAHTAAAGGELGSATHAAQLSEQINTLRKELETKQKEIEHIKTSSAAAGATAAAPAGMSDADKAKLEAQIKDLQAKLQEYEIISEDIADLSFYKEQNAKLQKELEAAKTGAPVGSTTPASAAAVATSSEPAAAPKAEAAAEPVAVKEEPAIVGKAKAAEEAAPAPTPEATPAAPEEATKTEAAPATESTAAAPGEESAAPAEAAPVENVIDDQLMAEFAAAVQKQKGGEAGSAPETPAAQPAVASPAAAAPKAEGEFNLGEVDIEKMVQEAGGITGDGPEVTAEQALGTSVDAEKLLQEASALQGVNPEEKKLMGDFENFVKKNEG